MTAIEQVGPTGKSPIACQQLQQFGNGLSRRQNRNRPPRSIVQVMIRIDAEAMIDRREQAIAVHRPNRRIFAACVRGADDLAHAQAAAGKKDAH
jgi:hypothetical protein